MPLSLLRENRKNVIFNDLRKYHTSAGLHESRIKDRIRPQLPKAKTHSKTWLINNITDLEKTTSNYWFSSSPIGYIINRITFEPKINKRAEDNIDYTALYKTHDRLTDKKLLGTITLEEEVELGGIRNKFESHNNKNDLDLDNYKIDTYQELLKEIKELKKLLKSNRKR